jgi:hypothetical protein
MEAGDNKLIVEISTYCMLISDLYSFYSYRRVQKSVWFTMGEQSILAVVHFKINA